MPQIEVHPQTQEMSVPQGYSCTCIREGFDSSIPNTEQGLGHWNDVLALLDSVVQSVLFLNMAKYTCSHIKNGGYWDLLLSPTGGLFSPLFPIPARKG